MWVEKKATEAKISWLISIEIQHHTRAVPYITISPCFVLLLLLWFLEQTYDEEARKCCIRESIILTR